MKKIFVLTFSLMMALTPLAQASAECGPAFGTLAVRALRSCCVQGHCHCAMKTAPGSVDHFVVPGGRVVDSLSIGQGRLYAGLMLSGPSVSGSLVISPLRSPPRMEDLHSLYSIYRL